jgi:tetratricopeptide (TPR) repeat protein
MPEDSRKERFLPQPDQVEAFFKQSLEFVRVHQKAIVFAAAAVVLAAAVIAGVIYFQKKAEEKAQALLGEAVSRLESAERSKAPEDAYAEVKADLQKIVEEYGSTDAGKAAMLKYADLCYRTGDYEAAIEMYQGALEAYRKAPDVRALIVNGLAYAHEGRGDYDKAARYFRRIVEEEAAPLKAQALFNLGRIYGEMEKPEKQKAAFEQLVKEYPDSMYYPLAREALAG